MVKGEEGHTSESAARPATVRTVHDRLRQDILRGRLAPGSVLSQVRLAAEYGVSRTPLREAMRMLQEEGLLHAETNRRAHVATFHLDDLEAISAQRILASALATSLTVGRMDASALGDLMQQFDLMAQAAAAGDAESWRRANLAFHELHTARAPQLLVQDMRRLQERNALYRAIWLRDEPHLDPQSATEHRQILAGLSGRRCGRGHACHRPTQRPGCDHGDDERRSGARTGHDPDGAPACSGMGRQRLCLTQDLSPNRQLHPVDAASRPVMFRRISLLPSAVPLSGGSTVCRFR